MNEINNRNSTPYIESVKSRHKKWVYASNACYQFPESIMGYVQGAFLLSYFEIVVGLNAWLVFLAATIFIFYDAVNDPLIGFLVDRNLRFTKKWGRRFPWIAIGIAPWCLTMLLFYSVPGLDATANPLPVFGWLLLSLLIHDTFSSLVNVNNSALRPDKFRTEEERRTFAKYYTPLDMIALIIGMLLPAVFINMIPGDKKAGYGLMGIAIAIISLIFALLYLPGTREDEIMIERYYSPSEIDNDRMSFFKALKKVLKTKSVMVYFIFTMCWGITITIFATNVLYLTEYVLRISIDTYIIILGIFLLGTLISLPFWFWYIKKLNNNKKLFVIGGLAYSAALIPLTFFQGLGDLAIMAFIVGFVNGCTNAFLFTILSPTVYDDFVVRTKKNQKGVLIGILVLLNRLTATIDELIFAIVHSLTGFQAGYDTYDKMAAVVPDMTPIIGGIRLLMGVIPAVILLVGTLIFWKYFPLTQDIILKNKAELEKLNF